MTAVSFLILEKRSQLIEKHRFKKYIFSKIENDFYIFYREYSNGVVNNEMRLDEDYIEFIQSLSKETEGSIYFLMKNLVNNEMVDNFSIKNYLSAESSKNIQKLDGNSSIEFNKLPHSQLEISNSN